MALPNSSHWILSVFLCLLPRRISTSTLISFMPRGFRRASSEQEITAVTASLNGVLQGGRVIYLYKDGVLSTVRLKVIVNADSLLAEKSI